MGLHHGESIFYLFGKRYIKIIIFHPSAKGYQLMAKGALIELCSIRVQGAIDEWMVKPGRSVS